MDTRLKQEQASIKKTPARKRSSSRDKGSLGERLFQIFNICFFIGMGLTTLIPFVNLIAKSFSSEAAVVSGSVNLFPIGFQIGTYRYVLQDILFIQSFRTSVIVTVLGTLLGLLFTTLTAYPLSKLRLRGRKWFLLYFIFTMLFSGGLIPTYLLMQELKLVNSIGVLFLPGMVNIFYLLLIKNYFEGLPESLEESAKIDGAGHLRILVSIVLPLSLPVLATIGLFFAVQYWNDYFAAMIYISNPEIKPLQLFLKEMLVASSNDFLKDRVDAALNTTPQSIQAASILLATLPILLVYPFLQKYFVKGVLIGSVKG